VSVKVRHINDTKNTEWESTGRSFNTVQGNKAADKKLLKSRVKKGKSKKKKEPKADASFFGQDSWKQQDTT